MWTGYTGNSNYPIITFGEPVDFMSMFPGVGGINSYYETIMPPIAGFTNNFNEGGYTQGIGLGGSQYLKPYK